MIPTDKEIEDLAKSLYRDPSLVWTYYHGACWMRDQIGEEESAEPDEDIETFVTEWAKGWGTFNRHMQTTAREQMKNELRNLKTKWRDKNSAVSFKEPPTASFGEWQLCPKCNALGNINIVQYSGLHTLIPCDVCKGEKIIARPLNK